MSPQRQPKPPSLRWSGVQGSKESGDIAADESIFVSDGDKFFLIQIPFIWGRFVKII
jgi:hypothetical protein